MPKNFKYGKAGLTLLYILFYLDLIWTDAKPCHIAPDQEIAHSRIPKSLEPGPPIWQMKEPGTVDINYEQGAWSSDFESTEALSRDLPNRVQRNVCSPAERYSSILRRCVETQTSEASFIG